MQMAVAFPNNGDCLYYMLFIYKLQDLEVNYERKVDFI